MLHTVLCLRGDASTSTSSSTVLSLGGSQDSSPAQADKRQSKGEEVGEQQSCQCTSQNGSKMILSIGDIINIINIINRGYYQYYQHHQFYQYYLQGMLINWQIMKSSMHPSRVDLSEVEMSLCNFKNWVVEQVQL